MFVIFMGCQFADIGNWLSSNIACKRIQNGISCGKVAWCGLGESTDRVRPFACAEQAQ